MEAIEDIQIAKTGEAPLFSRLKYISPEKNQSNLVTPANKNVRDIVYKQTIQKEVWHPLKDLIQPDGSVDILISQSDRYGLPQRTVVCKATGLMRTDPFYTTDYLNTFYVHYYRDLYSNNEVSRDVVLREQIDRGSGYFRLLKNDLKEKDKVLEIGCGMGGILIPFKLAGMQVTGIDLGPEFISLGNKFDLNLYVKSVDDLLKESTEYDLIILSHVIEHIPDLNNFLGKVKTLLTPAGKIFIAVPGIKYIHETYNGNLHLYLQNAHCWSFTKTTLTAILNMNDLNVNYIDEQINCIASKASKRIGRVDVTHEGDNVISYLENTEKQFQKKTSFLRRAYRSVMLRTETLLFGRF
ncbi:MAG: class I SAM-dependent methyltransferase [Bacteroidota bacterium]